MRYIDTSVLTAYYCPESLSDRVEIYFTKEQPAISSLTELEFFSAISRKVREGQMNRLDAGRVLAKFLSHVDSDFYLKKLIDSLHYRLARDWIGQFNTSLRSLDALHLALASSEDMTLVSSDKVLAQSAKALGIEVIWVH